MNPKLVSIILNKPKTGISISIIGNLFFYENSSWNVLEL